MDWIKRFILFQGKKHPATLGAPAVEQFLSHLAVQGHVAASTQNQALSALTGQQGVKRSGDPAATLNHPAAATAPGEGQGVT